ARRVLRLRPLEPLGAAPDARLRGEVLHKVMEMFARSAIDDPTADPDAAFDAAVAAGVAASGAPPAEAMIWRARLQRVKRAFLRYEAERRATGAPLDVEVDGRVALATVAGEVTLTGRADRIDRLATGALAIYDYKAGTAPSEKQVKFFAKQLPLLGAMAEAGAFEGVPTAAADELAYLTLSGGSGGDKPRAVETDADALKGLTILLNSFFDPDTPYLPRAFVEKARSYAGDYEHLSRFGEWSDRVPDRAPPGVAS
ncbi:MAG: PD-(D/E)XK nuclease family protein, partial [Pseudomonadota bacterium]